MRFRELKKAKKQHKKSDSVATIAYAKVPDRIKAFIVDMFMIYTPIIYIVVYLVMGSKEAFMDSQIAPLIVTLLYGIIDAGFISVSGQTPGKKAYLIEVVDAKNHKRISFMRALCRFFFFLVAAAPFLLGLLTVFTNKKRQAFHERLCGTITLAVKE